MVLLILLVLVIVRSLGPGEQELCDASRLPAAALADGVLDLFSDILDLL
jgi:hypothetical protein